MISLSTLHLASSEPVAQIIAEMLRRSCESAPGFVDTPSLGRKAGPRCRRAIRHIRRSSGSGKGGHRKSWAAKFEPSAQAIRNWVKQAALDAGERTDGLTTEERDELRRLRREVRQLREERAILSKAAAWFARETNTIPSKDSSS
jgi:transposase